MSEQLSSAAVIMRDEFLLRRPQRVVAEQNHPFQTGLLYRAHQALRVTIKVRDSIFTVMNQVARALKPI